MKYRNHSHGSGVVDPQLDIVYVARWAVSLVLLIEFAHFPHPSQSILGVNGVLAILS
jgi:hypothetical protein